MQSLSVNPNDGLMDGWIAANLAKSIYPNDIRMDGWMDGLSRIYVVFNSVLVISGRWSSDNMYNGTLFTARTIFTSSGTRTRGR